METEAHENFVQNIASGLTVEEYRENIVKPQWPLKDSKIHVCFPQGKVLDN